MARRFRRFEAVAVVLPAFVVMFAVTIAVTATTAGVFAFVWLFAAVNRAVT